MAFNWKNRPLFIGQPKIAGLGEAETLDAVYRPDSRFQGITNNLHPNLLMASTATDIDQTSAIEPEGIVGPKTLYPSMFEDPEGLKETFKDEEFYLYCSNMAKARYEQFYQEDKFLKQFDGK